MPDENAPQGVFELGNKASVSASARATSAAELMAQLGNAIQSGKSHTSSVATGEGLPALSKRLVENIVAGDYVDSVAGGEQTITTEYLYMVMVMVMVMNMVIVGDQLYLAYRWLSVGIVGYQL